MVVTRSKNLTAVMIAQTAPASPDPPVWLLGLPGAACLASRTAAADSWLAPRSSSRGLPRMSSPPQSPPLFFDGCPPCWQEQGSPEKSWLQVKAEEREACWPLQQEPGDQRIAQPGVSQGRPINNLTFASTPGTKPIKLVKP